MGLLSFLSLDCTMNQYGEDTIKKSVDLFKGAQKTIKVVAGRLDNEFYNNRRTIDALSNAINRGVSVNITYTPSVSNRKFRVQFKKQFPKVHVMAAKKIPTRHWVVVDGKHLRIEHTHREGAKITPAFVCKDASVLAEEWDKKFDSLV